MVTAGIANCSGVNILQTSLTFFVNMLNYRILIVQEENDSLVKSMISLVCIDGFS